MQKPWYAHLYTKSPIAKLVWALGAVIISIGLMGLLLLWEPVRMEAQTANWDGRSIEKGAEIWNSNCNVCHGVEGKGGTGPALNSKYFFTQRLKDLSYTGTMRDFVGSTVTSGRPSRAVSQWSVMMPTWSNRFGGPLRDDQIVNVTNFVLNWEEEALQQTDEEDPWIPFQDAPSSGDAGGEATGASASAPVASGPRPPQQLFTQNRPDGMGCYACHNIDAPQTTTERGLIGPNLGNLPETAGTRVPGMSADEYVHTSIISPNEHVVEGYMAGVMLQDFGTEMTEEEINGLVAWLLNPNRPQ
jgi:mono/diheme cytochrome c family protein